MNVRVVVRVRPLLPIDKKQLSRLKKESRKDTKSRSRRSQIRTLCKCVVRESESLLKVTRPVPKKGEESEREFAFEQVMDETINQSKFFDTCGIRKLVNSVLQGYAAAVFAYGQTGSGKTYTMSGHEEQIKKGGFRSPETDGLIPRALSYLYAQIQAQKRDISISASYLEIYNEHVYDLLNVNSQPLPLRFQQGRGFFVEKQLVVECESFEDLCAVATEGHKNRTVRSHNMNIHSSRSHSIFTVYVELKGGVDDEDGVADVGASSLYGKISFIDLAGSENVKHSQSAGEALKETNNINKSLFTLGKVISVLALMHRGKLGEDTHIPYRDSVLTKLLMDSLGGNGIAMMIACCSPSNLHVDETLRTLQYATRAKNIRNRPVLNINSRDRAIMQLKEELRALRHQNGRLRELLEANGIPAPPAVPRSVSMSSSRLAALGSARGRGAAALGGGGGGAGALGGRPADLSRNVSKVSVLTSRPITSETSLPPPETDRTGQASRQSDWWGEALQTPVANFHDQTGMLVKSPTLQSDAGSARQDLLQWTTPRTAGEESTTGSSARVMSGAGATRGDPGSPISRSQGRFLRRVEKLRSSGRVRRHASLMREAQDDDDGTDRPNGVDTGIGADAAAAAVPARVQRKAFGMDRKAFATTSFDRKSSPSDSPPFEPLKPPPVAPDRFMQPGKKPARGSDANAVASDRQKLLAEENMRLKNRLEHLEKIFVKRDIESPRDHDMEDDGGVGRDDPYGSFGSRMPAPRPRDETPRLLSVSTAPLNIATPNALPSYSSEVSTPVTSTRELVNPSLLQPVHRRPSMLYQN